MSDYWQFVDELAPVFVTICIAVIALLSLWRLDRLKAENARRLGYEAGRSEVLNSLRYEQEIYETRRSGLIKKETTLRIRERVMLGHLRIAEIDREVTLNSEVDVANLWAALEQMSALLISVNPSLGAVKRVIGPAAKVLLARDKQCAYQEV